MNLLKEVINIFRANFQKHPFFTLKLCWLWIYGCYWGHKDFLDEEEKVQE